MQSLQQKFSASKHENTMLKAEVNLSLIFFFIQIF